MKNKLKYSTPKVSEINIDNEISLILQSPPVGPNGGVPMFPEGF